MHDEAWHNSPHCTLGALIAVGEDGAAPTERLLLVWHAGRGHARLALPPGPWSLRLHSARGFVALDASAGEPFTGTALDLHETQVCLLVQTLQGGTQTTPTPT